MFGLNLHSALLQDFHSVIGNAPKEFVSQKLSTQSTARENTEQGDTKFHYVVLLYVQIENPYRSSQRLSLRV